MIVTIDGPSGTGKSTVAKRVAEALGFIHFDTGAMYRAFTWHVLQSAAEIPEALATFHFSIRVKGKEKRYFVNDCDVTEIIRSHLITAKVSKVSAIKEVRDALLGVQRKCADEQDCVFEGRDLGSVVFPNAEVKIFLDADPEVRAERRLKEILLKNPEEAKGWSREKMLQEIVRRDAYDSSREVAPLKCPEGAFKVDTTHLTIEAVVDLIVEYCKKKKGKR